jgi:hypothetical protein
VAEPKKGEKKKETEGNTELPNDAGKPITKPNNVMENTAILPFFFHESEGC